MWKKEDQCDRTGKWTWEQRAERSGNDFKVLVLKDGEKRGVIGKRVKVKRRSKRGMENSGEETVHVTLEVGQA